MRRLMYSNYHKTVMLTLDYNSLYLKIETSSRISRAVVLDVIGGSFERVLGRVGVGLRQRLLSSGQGHRVLHRAPHVVALAVKARRV